MNSFKNEIKAKPFIKWAGGKGQLLDKFLSFYPKELKSGKISNYCEPFIGGGAVFFDVVQRFNIRNATIYDINEELVLTYKTVQKDVVKLMERLNFLSNEYKSLNDLKRTEYYYKERLDFNRNRLKTDYSKYSESWINRAAQIIFLNKTCFNGLFRFNLKGEFNVPAGRYKNPTILDEQNIRKVSGILQATTIKKADFIEVEKDIVSDSFVYFDPPYRPLNATSSFTSYSKYKFEDAEQIKLSELFKRLDKKGIKLMLSNSDPKNHNINDNFFDEIYKDYHIVRIPATRSINSNASKRSAINEIVVTNY